MSAARPFRIFVLEDDVWYSELVVHHLSLNPEYEVSRYHSATDLFKNLHIQPDVITLDYSLPDMQGDEVLNRIKTESPNTAVIVISGQENVSTAVDLLRKGAYDYLVKDEDTRERLWNTVSNIRKNVELKNEIDQLRREVGQAYEVRHLLKGNCEPMKRVYELIAKAAKARITVSVTGETGTGKELVAKAIHFNSSRSSNPFVAVNLSSIPADLIEAELFGHEKGAFTGAVARRIGKFEQANGGTLFLDEIAELDISLQAKILRVLQEMEITRVGSNQVIKLDVRIIVATHKDFAAEVRKGNFREDLYYRLLGLPIHLPPLRERGNDILLLAKHFLDYYSLSNEVPRKILQPEAREKLLSYPWPGNVRELKAVMELATVMTDEREIYARDITFINNNFTVQMPSGDQTLEQYNMNLISHYLKKNNGNVVETAKKLAISKSTIYNLLKEKKI